jgi:hypothetical protein
MKRLKLYFSYPLLLFSVAGSLLWLAAASEAARAGDRHAPSDWSAPSRGQISLNFQPPGDAAPLDTTGGGTRGTVNFKPPGDAAPANSLGGGTRGNINFQAPGDAAPNNSASGGTRGNVGFQAPGDAAPNNSASGGTRGNVGFQAPGDAAPNNSASGGTRGNVGFEAPGEGAPSNSASGGTRGNVGFEPPGEGAPSNSVSGGTRSEALAEVKPLLPSTQHGRTVSARPTIFVYVPPTDARQVFFSLQDQYRNHHYQTVVEISGRGGIVSVTLPEDAPELEIGKDYVWFFAPIQPGEPLGPDTYKVTGWVKRVESPSSENARVSANPMQQATTYAESGIWYDTLSVLAAAKQAQPEEATWVEEWHDLLEQVGLEAIASQPFSDRL